MNTDLKLGGIFSFEHIRDGKVIDSWEEPNLVVDEGLTYALGNAFDGTTPSMTAWYVAIFTGNATPLNTWTAATVSALSTETTSQYSEATRPAWVEAGVVSKTIGNSASPASFTFQVATTDVHGAFLVSANAKGGTTGILAAASKFTSMRTLLDTDVLNVTYTLTASST